MLDPLVSKEPAVPAFGTVGQICIETFCLHFYNLQFSDDYHEHLFASSEKWDPRDEDGIDYRYHIIYKGTLNQDEG